MGEKFGESAQATIIEYHRLRGLNTDLFLTVLEAGKSKIRVPASLIPGKGSLPTLLLSTFSLCSHGSGERERERERARNVSGVL